MDKIIELFYLYGTGAFWIAYIIYAIYERAKGRICDKQKVFVLIFTAAGLTLILSKIPMYLRNSYYADGYII